MVYRTDLHIHSCLSPCGSLELPPSEIARLLAARGVQVAALTDHNTALNCPAFAKACSAHGIVPLFGMEAQTQEECHILCLFGCLEAALAFSGEIYTLLPPVRNQPEKTGDQVYVDEEDNILGEVEKYLITCADLDIFQLAEKVHAAGGAVIPAHAERPAFSLSSQLGFIPEGPWNAVEVVRLPPSADTKGYPLTVSSDSHYPEHVARRTFLLDTADESLTGADGTVDMDVFKRALARCPRG